jgi:hypothetical protein
MMTALRRYFSKLAVWLPLVLDILRVYWKSVVIFVADRIWAWLLDSEGWRQYNAEGGSAAARLSVALVVK